MMTIKKAQSLTEVVDKRRRRSCGGRSVAMAGLLLAESTAGALAADPAAGERIFKTQCGICHAVTAGQTRIGPTMFGVVGRPAGGVPGFPYTPDHAKLGIVWDEATLDKYLANPRAMVPDTSMFYPGLKDDAKRADLIAYLETLH